MQGRLSPPVDGRFQFFPRLTWQQEIIDAATVGLDAIEWIYDVYGDGANPIETDEGIAQIRSLSDKSCVTIESICADWFMEELLIGVDGGRSARARTRLEWLLGRGQRLGISRVVLPFVDSSALKDSALVDEAVALIERVLPLAHDSGIELHLETSLDPDGFASFLERLPDPSVKVNYDIGNSASLGFDPQAEMLAYGHRIGSVHIKDRILGGATVSLGTGNADFDTVFGELARLGYEGPFILQAARGKPGQEIDHLKSLVTIAKLYIETYFEERG